MITQIYKWKCTLLSTSPLKIGSDDEDIVLDQFDRPFIPGTSIAGACRAFAQSICSAKDVNTLFGGTSGHGKNTVLIFSDGRSFKDYMLDIRPSVNINGATKTNKNLFKRNMIASGATFDITITLKTTLEEHEKHVKIVEQMLQAIHSGVIRLGSYKSTGSGKFLIQSCEVVHYDCTKEEDLIAYVNESKPFEKVTIAEGTVNEGFVQITLKGRTKTPLLVGGHAPIDAKDPDVIPMKTPDGKPIIPGSSIKGVLRHRVTRIANVLQLKEKDKYISYLFGSSDEGVGTLRLEDIVIKNEKSKVYHRIAINPLTGGTKDGALLQQETLFGEMETTLQFQLKEEGSNVSLALLIFALRDLALQKVSIGSGASIGRGFLDIQHIKIEGNEKEVVLDVASKQTTGNVEWLQQLQKALVAAK